MKKENIGIRVREQRAKLGLSQQSLASKVGVTQGLIGQIEAGINKGSKHIVAIAKALGVSPNWLEGEDSLYLEHPLTPYQSPQSSEVQSLLRAWQSASEEAKEVARFALASHDAPLPPWADKDKRQHLDSMLYAALCWLRSKSEQKKDAA